MKTISKTGCWAAGLVLACAAATAQAEEEAPPPVLTSYSFNGLCTDCFVIEATPNADVVAGVPIHATLVVANYTGGGFTLENFVSFSYYSDIVGSLFTEKALNFSGSIEDPLPGFEDVFIQWDRGRWTFTSCNDGACTPGEWSLFDRGTIRDVGVAGIWGLAAAPEPASFALLLLGLAGLGVMRRARS